MSQEDCTCSETSQFEGTWCGPCSDGKSHRIDCPFGKAAREEQGRVLRAVREQPTKAAPPNADCELADLREECDLFLESRRISTVDFDTIVHKRLIRLEEIVAKITATLTTQSVGASTVNQARSPAGGRNSSPRLNRTRRP